ncbi:MAG: PA2779 family protein [Nitrospirota bacterium]
MKHLLSSFYTRPLVIYLVLAIVALTTAAGPAEAMLLPTPPDAASAPSPDRAADLAKVQKVLESKELRQKLRDHGLSPEETDARINALPDEQLHRLASNMDSVQAGGDVVGFVFGLVIIGLLVLLIIFLLEGRIEIRRT